MKKPAEDLRAGNVFRVTLGGERIWGFVTHDPVRYTQDSIAFVSVRYVDLSKIVEAPFSVDEILCAAKYMNTYGAREVDV